MVTPGTISKGIPGGQRFHFFTASTEDQRIAAFEPHHHLAALRTFDQQGLKETVKRLREFAAGL